MADWATISSLATAGGTLVLALATFSSVRSANRSARVAEQALLVGLRPVLSVSRREDAPERIRFGGGRWLEVRGGTARIEQEDSTIYVAMSLRNVGSGLAVLRGWHVLLAEDLMEPHIDPEQFRPQRRDIYVPPSDRGFWQGAIREDGDEARELLRGAIDRDDAIAVDLLYGDHEGGQRTITRFTLSPEGDDDWAVQAVRHWSLDRANPR
jgi:hypothetical protein